jgi:hypothetical protein
MNKARNSLTFLLAAVFSFAVAGPQCLDDHWDPLCNGGVPTPFGAPYFSCYTNTGGPYCCQYLTQNHSCVYPPPSLAKFFWFTGISPGACNSNAQGQWCDDVEP